MKAKDFDKWSLTRRRGFLSYILSRIFIFSMFVAVLRIVAYFALGSEMPMIRFINEHTRLLVMLTLTLPLLCSGCWLFREHEYRKELMRRQSA